MRGRTTVFIIAALVAVAAALVFAVITTNDMDGQADAASPELVTAVDATTDDTDETGMRRWIREPECPEDSFTATMYVGTWQTPELEMTVPFAGDGFANDFTLHTDIGTITDIYLLRRVHEFGHPDDFLVDWSLIRFVPEYPNPTVAWNTGDLILTADDALRVCIAQSIAA